MIDTQYYFVCLVLLFLSTLLLKSLFKKPSKTLRLPPSPPALPIIGHLHLLGSSLSQSLHKLSTKYGPLLYLRLGASRCLVVSTASLATEIFKTKDLVFSDRPSFAFSDRLPYGNYGFFSARYGDYWRFIKQLCMSELLSTRQVEQSCDVRHEEIVCFLLKALESAKKQHVFDVGAELMKLTNNSTCKLTMSMRCSEEHDEAERIRQLVKESMEVGEKIVLGDVFGPLKILAFWLYGKKAINGTLKYDAILEKVLKQHEESPQKENKDLMDILLKVYQDDKAEFKINRTHLKAFLLIEELNERQQQSQSYPFLLSNLGNKLGLNNNGVRDEARDKESELGLNNNGLRDEASNEDRDETREELNEKQQQSQSYPFLLSDLGNELDLKTNGVRDEARDEDSELGLNNNGIEKLNERQQQSQSYPFLLSDLGNKLGLNNNGMRDEARDEESELGLNNNGV
ncbi:cytochrome P450 705A12-like [Fagus crenata]